MACFISAGHNNHDPGASGLNNRTEAAETIKFRDAVVKYCQQKGLKVITDNDEESLAQYLKRIETGEGSVVIEFHFDAFNKTASGTTALVGNDADRLDKMFAQELSTLTSEILGVTNRGVKSESESHRGRLGLMREQGTVCLLEICFIDNAEDMSKYDQNFFSLASGVANIIEKYEKIVL